MSVGNGIDGGICANKSIGAKSIDNSIQASSYQGWRRQDAVLSDILQTDRSEPPSECPDEVQTEAWTESPAVAAVLTFWKHSNLPSPTPGINFGVVGFDCLAESLLFLLFETIS
jgi:hypothetical protein